jgi:hypothetical protein
VDQVAWHEEDVGSFARIIHIRETSFSLRVRQSTVQGHSYAHVAIRRRPAHVGSVYSGTLTSDLFNSGQELGGL